MSSEFLDLLFLRNYNTRLVVVGVSLLGATTGLLGSFLLLRKRSLMGDALSHATLPGIVIAFLLANSFGADGKSLPLLLLGAMVSGLLGVGVVSLITRTTHLKQDAAMGLVLSVFFGFGVALMGLAQTMPNAAGLESFIYGKTASLVRQDVLYIMTCSCSVLIIFFVFYKEFKLLSFDEGFAASQGWPVVFLDLLMLGLVTLATVVGLQAVGLVLIIAFLIIPAAAARFWTHHLPSMLVLSIIFGASSGYFGAILSASMPRLPAGAVIVLVAAFFFLVSMFFGSAKGVIPRNIRHSRLKRKVGRQHLLRAIYELLEKQQKGAKVLENVAIFYGDLLAHRFWPPRQLKALLHTARREDHLEEGTSLERIHLSESGFGEALRITRNHRLWELYLIKHADIAPSHVDRDADLVEHVLGAELVRQLENELETSLTRPEVPPSPHEIIEAQAQAL